MNRLDKPCEVCGEMMFGVAKQRVYCDKCRKIRDRELDTHSKREKKPKKQIRKSTIDEIARLAREKGISYGKYVALYRSGV